MKAQKRYVLIMKTRNAKPWEISAGWLLVDYFQSDVIFIKESESLPTADFLIVNTNEIWELKSPEGRGKNTIHHQFEQAVRQSLRIVIDLRRMRLQESRAMGRIMEQLLVYRNIRKVLVIHKNETIERIK